MFDAETWSRMRGISVATARARLGQYRDRAQLFAIRDAGEDQYPRFQFDTEGLPLPDVAMILTRVPEPARGWPVLSWFATSNARLAGRKPHEVLMAPRLTRPAVGLATRRPRDEPTPFRTVHPGQTQESRSAPAEIY